MPGPPPPGPATSRSYGEARLTAYSVVRGAPGDPLRYLRGAVHTADGELVAASQRSGGHRGDLVRCVDPPRVAGRANGRRLAGRWLYGGHWMGHFGHFLTETLTSLWPAPGAVDGLVFHRFLSPPAPQRWQRDLLHLLGWSVPVRVVALPHVVEELVVPSRPLVLNQHAGPEALDVWRRVAAAASDRPFGGDPLFLSRSRVADAARRTPGDEDLDEVAVRLGLRVVHPQELTVVEQVRAVASAPLLAGVSGSALHLSAFAPAPTRVLEVGDGRRLREDLFTQDVIDGSLGHESALVPLVRGAGSSRRDLVATEEAMAGLLAPAVTSAVPRVAALPVRTRTYHRRDE